MPSRPAAAKDGAVSAAMERAFDFLEDEAPEREEDAAARAAREAVSAHARLSEVAPAGTPGRAGGPADPDLLSSLRDHGVGETDLRRPEDPCVPWEALPEKKALLFGALDLEHYFFLTGRSDAAGYAGRPKERLYDLPEDEREVMSEEEIAGAHGMRHEFLSRLYRLLDAALGANRPVKSWTHGCRSADGKTLAGAGR